ncbi:hypothetical protein [Limnohabitans radicicola]|uniref:Uncharacterized protein n=1 Tax=Limnohabitans radicicola TaxID=2771427 RepID=A0A927FJ86_9BURK|nr:hypothetical protein [Limnohabitans radicicola]MBD8051073.1 hypothetical protein [Limnohabitans radicicola]
MSPFDFKSEDAAQAAWRAQAHAEATQKLAQALAQQEAIRPATNASEFQLNLSLVIDRLAHEELALIENMTGMELLEKLAAAQAGEPVDFTPAQAHALGAFPEDAISDGDLDVPDDEGFGQSGQKGAES